MAIMIPVYVVNALYLWPITLWTYIKYGRPPKLHRGAATPSHAAHHSPHGPGGEGASHEHSTRGGNADLAYDSIHDTTETRKVSVDDDGKVKEEHGHHNHSHGSGERPMFATVTVAVCHCGAGCVIGDIIGEWLVYGTNATINGRTLWPEYLIDFAFALALGIVFQYYSIAPMTGAYGPKMLYRAAKADFLSLTFFEVGLFGWMAIFQIAIFRWKLEMNTVTYWWMMQIGMFLRHRTAVPINWWLIKTNVKEPCA
ncbi:hypothetical protein LTS14_010565 [Recurvomyces mirabilis]|nr:hypothetical protein LTS14_010565 [Recurvomyces mirabilis]